MKKRWILLILPLMMMVMPVATANGWGLPEALVPLVSNTNDYDDYYHLADDYARKENSARIIMQSRYHNQLIAAEKGADGWEGVIYSTTAVYQPSEQSTSGKPKLARINNGFELAYPKVKELYRFERINNDRGETAYTLTLRCWNCAVSCGKQRLESIKIGLSKNIATDRKRWVERGRGFHVLFLYSVRSCASRKRFITSLSCVRRDG